MKPLSNKYWNSDRQEVFEESAKFFKESEKYWKQQDIIRIEKKNVQREKMKLAK